MDQAWYTVEQAQRKLSVSRETLRHLEQRGVLVPARVGRRVYYYAEELARCAEQRETVTPWRGRHGTDEQRGHQPATSEPESATMTTGASRAGR